jgi:hypothetical protein
LQRTTPSRSTRRRGHAARAVHFIAGWLALTGIAVAQETMWLGDAPRLSQEPQLHALVAPGPLGTPAIVINPQNRNQVALAYQTIYLPQGNVAAGWNGNVGSCTAGTTSAAYQEATIGRVNFYRALSGLPGNVTLFGNPPLVDTQAAALIFSANESLSHAPPSNWLCWTQAGADGAGHSNIALGYGSDAAAGPGAVDLYMGDGGTNNTAAGHRRWILFPPQAQMATGSIPYNPQWASNALWVLGDFGSRPPTPNGVAWPSRGYVPWQLLPASSNRWSFSWPSADFSNATVSMTRNGQPLGVPSYESVQNGYGDNTLVWKPQGVTYSQPGQDVVYHVVVSGIGGGGAPQSIAYDVIVIDPYVVSELIFESGFD